MSESPKETGKAELQNQATSTVTPYPGWHYDPTDPRASPRSGIVLAPRFKPGESGNPGGRPKGADPRAALRAELARKLTKLDTGEEVGEKCIELARDILAAALAGDLKKVSALAMVIDQAQGKPKETVENIGSSVRTIVVEQGVDFVPAMPTAARAARISSVESSSAIEPPDASPASEK